MGPQEVIEIPYNEEFLNKLKPKTSTSYYIIEIYKDNKLIKSFTADEEIWEKNLNRLD